MMRVPLSGLFERAAAVEQAFVALLFVPFACRIAQLFQKALAFAIVFEPLAQTRPAANQRLMRHFDPRLHHSLPPLAVSNLAVASLSITVCTADASARSVNSSLSAARRLVPSAPSPSRV